MEFELVGKNQTRKYYHKHCYGDFLKDKAFKEKEAKEKDELVETIKRIYGVKEVPSSTYPLIEGLRNGNKVFGNKQKIGKRYKQGYSYNLIMKTFEYCEDTIQYWNGVKDFDSFSNAFKYGLTIVIDKIYFVEQREKEREARDIVAKKHSEKSVIDSDVFESNYKKRKDDNDISSFLD